MVYGHYLWVMLWGEKDTVGLISSTWILDVFTVRFEGVEGRIKWFVRTSIDENGWKLHLISLIFNFISTSIILIETFKGWVKYISFQLTLLRYSNIKHKNFKVSTICIKKCQTIIFYTKGFQVSNFFLKNYEKAS